MKLGIFESGLPNCSHDAGSTAIVELGTLAQASGHVVEYCYTGQNPWGREDDLAQANIPATRVAASTAEEKAAFLRGKAFDAAIISRPGPALQWMESCREMGLSVIYFGHDIHHLRMARGNVLLPPEQQTNARDLVAIKALEQHVWKQAAAVLYPCEEEAVSVNAFCGQQRALAMPIYDIEDACTRYAQSKNVPRVQPPVMLFVGGAHHQPNEDGVRWFIADVLPAISTPCQLQVVGDWPPEFAAAFPQAQFTGRLNQDALFAAYKAASLVIAPLRFGAGVKRKVVEALAFEKPVISTPIGFEGIALPEVLAPQLCVPAEPQRFAALIESWLAGDLIAEDVPIFSRELRGKYANTHRKTVLEKALAMTKG